jgi:hypothetical protein
MDWWTDEDLGVDEDENITDRTEGCSVQLVSCAKLCAKEFYVCEEGGAEPLNLAHFFPRCWL